MDDKFEQVTKLKKKEITRAHKERQEGYTENIL